MTWFPRIGLGSVEAVAAVALTISLVAARHPRSAHSARAVPNACALLTATEATTLGGFPASIDSSQDAGNSANSCIYKRTGSGTLDPDVVEITTRTYPDAPSAHTDFPKWVNPLLKPNPIMIWTPASAVGDEATIEHTTLKPGSDGISFRSGAVLVKMGVYPPASDSALATTARTMVSRM